MASRRAPRKCPVEWVVSPWERATWRAEETFQPVLKLIETAARQHHREDYIEQLTELPDNDVRVTYSVDDLGRLTFERLRKERRAVVMVLSIQRIIRSLEREDAARIVRQVSSPDTDGIVRRKIEVGWWRQELPVAEQLKRLQQAVNSASQFKFE